ncbi:hypothetical protein B0I31_104480 [Saccharothrix carnea]|uniref:NB-ARC domain-containing protein n=1 Tax=Saccharothrix carnea TaxID=1280637 RepID=A0A2P8ICK3_SACCR|nr:hypothetical protein [Saccharothrix carnea]PSL56189.1 hypothetical protein B0I31_104480 [Saccharothrix carnea]
MGTRRRPGGGREALGQVAVAAGAAQVIQVGRDLHVHQSIDRRLDAPRPVLRPDDLVRRPLPATLARTLRSPVRGRADDLAFVRDSVAAGRHVVVTGPKGAGKTLLLQHAANTGALSVGDDVGLLWPARVARSVADVLGDLVHECYELDAGTVVPEGLARRLLADVRAVVVLDGVDLPPDDARLVVSALPRSVFVLTSRRDDLWVVGRQRVLGGLPLADTLAMVRDEVGEPDVAAVESDWDACDGNPLDVLERAVLRDSARGLGVVPEGLPGAEALAQVVPIVLDSLTGRAREALRPLVALGDVWWGAELLSAVCGVPEEHGADKLARKRLAHREGDRFRVGDVVAGFAPPFADDDLPSLVDRVTEWVSVAEPDAIADELDVVERALKRTLAAELPETALALARAASAGLVWSRHWGALAIVLGLGLRAAIGAGSVRDELSFRYALAVCRLNDGNTRQAAEVLAGAVGLAGDDGDERLAVRLRELDAEVRHLSARQPLSTVDAILARVAELGGTAAASAKAVRDACATALTSTPVGRLVQENPGVVRGVVSLAAVAGLVLTTMSASGSREEATAVPPTTSVTGQPPGAAGTVPDPTTTTAPDGPALTGPPAPTNGTTPRDVPGERRQPGTTDTDRTGTPPTTTISPDPPVPAATWGHVRVQYVETPIGTTRALSGPTVPNNDEANWTYGPWEMTNPAIGYPTATHIGVGRQRVRLPGVGAPGGSVKVTTFDYAAWYDGVGYRPGVSCQPSTWFQDGADEVVDVLCFDRAGNPDDVPFFLRYVAGSASGARGFVHDDQPTAATFTPDWRHGANAGVVTRTGVGRYTADFPGSAGGVVEVTAVGPVPRHCAVVGRRGQLADFACTAPGGSPADTAFTAAFTVRHNLLDDPRKPVGAYLVAEDSPTTGAPVTTTRWASGNAPMTLEQLSTGKYRVHLTNGYIRSTAHVTAAGHGNHCSVMLLNDYSRANDASVWIACFDPAGALVDTGFTLIYTSTRIY